MTRRAVSAATPCRLGAGAVVAIALAALLLVAAAPAGAQDPAAGGPWQAADTLRRGLFEAQTELILADKRAATRAATAAAAAYRGDLRARIRAADPEADAAVRRELRAARTAVAEDDAQALAAARGALQGAVFRGALAVTLDAVRAGDVATARAWLLLREFRTATRLTRPGADGTRALVDLEQERIDADSAVQSVRKDLLDAYQGRQRDLLGDAETAAQRGLPTRLAESAAQAASYWPILAPRLRRGPRAGGRRRRRRGLRRARARRGGRRRAGLHGRPRGRSRTGWRTSAPPRSRPTSRRGARSSCCASSRSSPSSTAAASRTRA